MFSEENHPLMDSMIQYTYPGLKYLNHDLDGLFDHYINNVYICAYQVNTQSLYPFLQFLLQTNPLNDTLSLPVINLLEDHKEPSLFLSYIEYYLSFILHNQLNENFIFHGFYYDKNNVYVFYDLTNCKIEIDQINFTNDLWLCIMDEIINEKKVCNINIDPFVSHFFLEHSEFIFLKNPMGKNIEIPQVAYIGKNENKLEFTYTFGVSKSENSDAMFGSYYYFTNYTNAIHEIINLLSSSNKKNNRCGIIRFALFLGNMTIKMNEKNDEVDDSNIKKERLQDNTIDQHYESLISRITDYNANWAEKYDSVFVSRLELDDGSFLKNTPIIVVKKYEQQYSLSYHYVSSQIIGTSFESKKQYCEF